MLPSLHKALLLLLPLALALRLSAQMIPVASNPVEESSSSQPTEPADPALSPVSTSSRSPSAAAGIQLPPPLPRHHPEPRTGPFSTVSMGITGGTLGPGVEFATPLARNLNLRVQGNYINLQYPFTIDGVNYASGFKLTAGQGLVDWFPTHGGFHVSGGILYFKSAVNATAAIAPAQQFKLGDQTYLNSVDDPVAGNASLAFPRKLAPLVLVGFGNLIPRSGRHISVPFEFGGAYLQPPQVNLQLAGTACTSQGCFNTATDPSAQANLAQENAKLNKDIRPLQIYPVVSIGFALRF